MATVTSSPFVVCSNTSIPVVSPPPKTQPSPLSRPVRIQALQKLDPPPISSTRREYSSARPQQMTAAPKSSPLAIPALSPGAGPKGGKKRRRSAEANERANDAMGSRNDSVQPHVPLKKRRRKGSRSSSPSPKRSPPSASSPIQSSSDETGALSTLPPRLSTSASTSLANVTGSTAASSVFAPTLEVRTISPTVRGISESARILLSRGRGPCGAGSQGIGVLSFPTETVYVLGCCVSVRRNVAGGRRSVERVGNGIGGASTCGSSGSSDLEEMKKIVVDEMKRADWGGLAMRRLMRIKGRLPPLCPSSTPASIPALRPEMAALSDPDPPFVFLHDPSHSRRFVEFTKPKTFALKPSAPDTRLDDDVASAADIKNVPTMPGTQSTSLKKSVGVLRPAVTFSESREVLDRLAAAFWPGPVAVFAPVKMRRTVGSITPARVVDAGIREDSVSTAAAVATDSSKVARGTSSSSMGEVSVEEGFSSSSSSTGGVVVPALMARSASLQSERREGVDGDVRLSSPAPISLPANQTAPILPPGALVFLSRTLCSSPPASNGNAASPQTERKDDSRQEGSDGGGTEGGSDVGTPENPPRRCYVGMRCPSHPLSRRILAEVYARNSASTPASRDRRGSGGGVVVGGGGSNATPCRYSVAVVGHSSSVSTGSEYCRLGTSSQSICASPHTKARDVCTALLSSSAAAATPIDTDKEVRTDSGAAPDSATTSPSVTTVHVLNGEDKREIFAVPTCQYGSDPHIPSLLIDDENRTVRILRRRAWTSTKKAPAATSSTQAGAVDVVDDVPSAAAHHVRVAAPSTEKKKKRRAPQPNASGASAAPLPEVRREDVMRALLKAPPVPSPSSSSDQVAGGPGRVLGGEGGVVASPDNGMSTRKGDIGEDGRRVIAAALGRWRVVEEEI